MNRFYLPLLFSLLAASACHVQSAPAVSDKPHEQWSGPRGGPEVATSRVAQREEEWSALWREISREPPRPLNASKEMAVAVFLGQRRTAGYSVEIVAARAEQNSLVVAYREKTPDPALLVAQVLTSPWAIAVTPRSDRPVVFRKLAGGSVDAK